MVAKNEDPKGEFLLELIEKRNYWLSKVQDGTPYNEDKKQFASAYERLIFAFTTPVKEPVKIP